MKLHFLRHGPTHAKTMVGWTDLPADLSNTARLDKIALEIPVSAICISSTLTRASATLDAVLGQRQILPADPDLREIHFGDWEDKSYSEALKENAQLAEDLWTRPGDIAPPNGESWNDLTARVSSAIDKIILDTDVEDVLIACHFGPILTQLARFTDASAKTVFGFQIDPLSLTTIETLGAGAARVLRVNHLL
ncbi:MAG: histidine phosphatase family protein [Pseudomonadota bacterium]